MANKFTARDKTLAMREILAFYLPQFHPIAENDQWWGKGFTEWTNVTKARALYRGHWQPDLPADLGFYDLRVPEVSIAQAQLAFKYGITGFCYWHYWFHGERLLRLPLDNLLANPNIPQRFCLAWANESWTRSWLGDKKNIIKAQLYSPEDDRLHIEWLLSVFQDSRYITYRGRPLFLVYRPQDHPDPIKFCSLFRDIFKANGLEDPYLIGINAHSRHTDMRQLGFDITEDHLPQLGVLDNPFTNNRSLARLTSNLRRSVLSASLKIYDYAESIDIMTKTRPRHPIHPGFFVGWDNTARAGKNAIVIHNNTPKAVSNAFRDLFNSSTEFCDTSIIFVNAWNEWAEGMHLEPCQQHQLSMLEALASVIKQ